MVKAFESHFISNLLHEKSIRKMGIISDLPDGGMSSCRVVCVSITAHCK
jgi:hypothetical protein